MKPEYEKYINELPISRRILLGGPTGSELYQETLARALSSHFQANFLSIDSSLFEIEKEKVIFQSWVFRRYLLSISSLKIKINYLQMNQVMNLIGSMIVNIEVEEVIEIS